MQATHALYVDHQHRRDDQHQPLRSGQARGDCVQATGSEPAIASSAALARAASVGPAPDTVAATCFTPWTLP